MEANKAKKNENKVFASCDFAALGLRDSLCKELEVKLGFTVPTHIQAQAIPVILSGKHVIVNAATGTGKTIVYLAPVVRKLLEFEKKISRSDGTFGTVFELLQKLLHRYYWIVPGYIMGGESRSKEKSRLQKGVSILIVTPGRLLDHLKNTEAFIHKKIFWLIFYEADRILELGFGKEIEEILTILGSRQDNGTENGVQRQNLLLSATLNANVNHLANISLHNPVIVGLDDKKLQPKPSGKINGSFKSDVDIVLDCSEKMAKPVNADYKLPAQLVQRYMKVPCGSLLAVLISILRKLFDGSASQKIHGILNHEDRRTTFNAFKIEKSAFLLSTDVSARGLDFPKDRCIIQYDSPGEAAEYVHRVGRTARLGERGYSLLFLQPVEIDYMQDLEKHGVLLTEYSLLKLLDSLPLYGHNQQPSITNLAMNAFCSWVRAYSAHRGELKGICMVKKLHLGLVAKSFALKEQPSLVGKSFQKQTKRNQDQKLKGGSNKKRRLVNKE